MQSFKLIMLLITSEVILQSGLISDVIILSNLRETLYYNVSQTLYSTIVNLLQRKTY